MTVSLQKNQTVSLSKAAPGLSKIMIGLGWDPVKQQKKGGFLSGLLGGGGNDSDDIDLDASVLLFDGSRNITDMVWFRQLRSNDGSVVHSGDNRTGQGDGDDETITVDLERLPSNVQSLVITVNSFQGQPFDVVDNAFARVVDAKTGAELAKFELRDKGSFTGVVMGVVSRQSGAWEFRAIGTPQNGRSVLDLQQSAAQYA
jgi:Uncharacterized proteins involved in stress response, homologs of TerZ and putative cAMP-binding protein CABP1